jgi:SAM-dependent methyltransferase
MLAATRQQFLEDYTRIRRAEGRGSTEAAYYFALPERDLTGRLQDQWRIRARSYQYLESRILSRFADPLRIADLGAGNCWMSHRLALRGHRPIAIDILNDALDGLGAGRHFQMQTPFPRITAEFDALPLATRSVDMAIYNASIHYSPDYCRTLAEVRRCLAPNGCFLIVDSPVYRRREHGEMMRRERHEQFQAQYGFASDALQSTEFFDEEMLGMLSRDLGISWTIHRPWYGVQWALRPWKARWQGRRPPSRFWVLQGTFA